MARYVLESQLILSGQIKAASSAPPSKENISTLPIQYYGRVLAFPLQKNRPPFQALRYELSLLRSSRPSDRLHPQPCLIEAYFFRMANPPFYKKDEIIGILRACQDS